MAATRVRVLIVDDHPLFADALKSILDRDPEIEVVGVAQSAGEAVDLALLHDAQVVLMDVGLPEVDGYEATRRLHAIKRAARVIAVSGRTEAEVAQPAQDAGMLFFLSKDRIHEHVHDAIMRACVA
jgi:DNA-binding NarL/FixJ family response regulator